MFLWHAWLFSWCWLSWWWCYVKCNDLVHFIPIENNQLWIYIWTFSQTLWQLLIHFLIWSNLKDGSSYEEFIEFSKKYCIGCIPAFIYGDYIYLNDNNDILKYYHNIFIKKQYPEITITSPMRLLDEILKTFPFFLLKTLLFNGFRNVQVFAQISIIDMCEQKSHKKYLVNITRKDV